MTCGIICRREIDDKPWPERVTHWDAPEPDGIDKALQLVLIVLLICTLPAAIIAGILAEVLS